MAAQVHTITRTDMTPLPFYTPEEGRTTAEILISDFGTAKLERRLQQAREAHALALEARQLENDWRIKVESAPKVGDPRLEMIAALKELRTGARVVSGLSAEEDAAGPVAAKVAAYLEVTGIQGSAWDVAGTADGLVAGVQGATRDALLGNTVMKKALLRVEAAEKVLDAVLREIIPGGMRQFRLLREQLLEKLTAAVFGAFADTDESPDVRVTALARYLEGRRLRSKSHAAARPRKKSDKVAATAIVT